MDQNALAQVLLRLARQDVNADNIGRLLISDCRSETYNPTLNGAEITRLFKLYYPAITVEARTENVILIYFDTKPEVRKRRSKAPPVKRIINNFRASTENIFHPEKLRDPEEFYAPKPDEQNVIW